MNYRHLAFGRKGKVNGVTLYFSIVAQGLLAMTVWIGGNLQISGINVIKFRERYEQ